MCQSICQSFSVEYIVNFLVYLHYLAPVQKKKSLLYFIKWIFNSNPSIKLLIPKCDFVVCTLTKHSLEPIKFKDLKHEKKLICLVEFAFAAQISEIHTMLKYQGIQL